MTTQRSTDEPTDTPALQTHGLTKRFDTGSGTVLAVQELDLTVRRGEVFGFLGPNGAGKTTTIDILLDFIRPSEGRATVLGYDAQRETDEVRQRIGILPEGFDLWQRSTGQRHLEFAIETKGGSATIEGLLNRIGLDEDDAKRKVGEYSKGMKQRLAMGMALAGEPELLILDEPSSGLDPTGIREMREIVRKEAEKGTTVFFSSHILSQVAAVCDRVGIIDDGEMVATDTIEGLRDSAGVGQNLVMEVDRPFEGDFHDIEGVVDVRAANGRLQVGFADPSAKAPIVHRVVEAGIDVRDLEIQEAGLEDLFEAYTNGEAAQQRRVEA